MAEAFGDVVNAIGLPGGLVHPKISLGSATESRTVMTAPTKQASLTANLLSSVHAVGNFTNHD